MERSIRTIICLMLAILISTGSVTLAQTKAGNNKRGDRPVTISVENIVDLTHTLTPEFPYIPIPGITFPFKATPIATMEKMGVAANKWDIHEHIGTQIDAPSHFITGGMSLEQLSPRNFIAPLAVIDISERASRDPDTSVTIDDIKTWERRYGRLPQDSAVFMYSGWETKVSDPKAFINMDSTNTMHFPGFAPETAAFLVRERQVVGIGVDTISLDPGKDKEYKAHKVWLAAGKWGVECVANLTKVPPAGATVFVGATKVGGATGGPVRLIATYPRGVPVPEAPSTRGQRLIGMWKSPAAESIGNGIFTTRKFSFTSERWRVEAVFYGDKEMSNQLFSFVAEGPYTLNGASSVVPQTVNAVFFFDKKTLTLLTEDAATISRFKLDVCNLVKGTPTNISTTGCSFFTSIADCGQEYDIVNADGNSLRLGMRPADRNMCTENRRPTALGLPVTRQNK